MFTGRAPWMWLVWLLLLCCLGLGRPAGVFLAALGLVFCGRGGLEW